MTFIESKQIQRPFVSFHDREDEKMDQVLIVDDSEMLINYLEDAFVKYKNKFAFFLAHDGLEAIEILKLNVEVFPESANVYDSLGEAYLKSEDKESAIKNYKKSLQLNPKNNNAKEMLTKLKEKNN